MSHRVRERLRDTFMSPEGARLQLQWTGGRMPSRGQQNMSYCPKLLPNAYLCEAVTGLRVLIQMFSEYSVPTGMYPLFWTINTTKSCIPPPPMSGITWHPHTWRIKRTVRASAFGFRPSSLVPAARPGSAGTQCLGTMLFNT